MKTEVLATEAANILAGQAVVNFDNVVQTERKKKMKEQERHIEAGRLVTPQLRQAMRMCAKAGGEVAGV